MRKIYAYLIALTVVFTCQLGQAQSLMWEELGPNNQGTHMRALTVDGSGNLWAGAVGGGLWKSTDQGASWAMVDGINDNLAVSCIYASGNNIYVGTGDIYFDQPATEFIPNWDANSSVTFEHGFFQYSSIVGEGVFVSNDGGSTWNHNNGTWNNASDIYNSPFISIQKISGDGNRVFITTLEGLYYSDNADLANLTKCDGPDTGFDDEPILDVEKGANSIVFASTADRLFRSMDNGATFPEDITDSIMVPLNTQPANQVGGARIEVSVAPSDPNIIYACGVLGTNQSASGIWRSTDGGTSFTRVGPKESSTFQPLQGNGQYTCVLEVNPTNPNAILLGGGRLYQYDDNNGWNAVGSGNYIPGFTTNYVPSPILSLTFGANDSTFYIGSDKETVGTFDYGQSFTFRTRGINAGTMQSIHAAPDYRIIASEKYQGLLYKANGNSTALQQQFTDINPAAATGGGNAKFSVTQPDFMIGQTADGGLNRSFNNGESWEPFYALPLIAPDSCFGLDSFFVDRPDTSQSGNALYDKDVAIVTPWVFDEVIAPADLSNDTTIRETPVYIYFGGGAFVWVCRNPFGDLDSLPTWDRLTLDITQDISAAPEYITAIEVSGDNSHTILVGTNYGNLYRISNANDINSIDCSSLDAITPSAAGWPSAWISDIAIEKGNPENAVITFGGYAQNSARVWLTNDAMSATLPTFTDVTGNLPSNLPVYTAAIHPAASQTVIVLGTEKGAYSTGDNYNTTTSLNWDVTGSAEIGKAPVYDLYFRDYYRDNLFSDNYAYGLDYSLFAATHGRGCFKTRTLVSNDQPTLVGTGIEMNLGPNPISELSNISLELPNVTVVKIEVFNLTGTHIGTLVNDQLAPGNYNFAFNSIGLPSGTYLFNAEFTTSKGRFYNTIKGVVAH